MIDPQPYWHVILATVSAVEFQMTLKQFLLSDIDYRIVEEALGQAVTAHEVGLAISWMITHKLLCSDGGTGKWRVLDPHLRQV